MNLNNLIDKQKYDRTSELLKSSYYLLPKVCNLYSKIKDAPYVIKCNPIIIKNVLNATKTN